MSISIEELRKGLLAQSSNAAQQALIVRPPNTMQQAESLPLTKDLGGELSLEDLQQGLGVGALDFEPEPQPAQGLFGILGSRLSGTDVSDPREFQRAATIAIGSLAGGLLGARALSPRGFVTPPTSARFTPVGPRTTVPRSAAQLLVNPVVGGVVGSAVGSVAGAVAPEAVLRELEEAGAVAEGTAAGTSLSDEELKTVARGEVLLDLATSGAFGTARALGRGIVRGLSGVAQSRGLADRSAELGLDLLPIQVGTKRIGRQFVSIFGRFPLVSGALVKQSDKVEAASKAFLNELPERARTGPNGEIARLLSRSELGIEIFNKTRNTINEISQAFGKDFDAIFREAEDLNIRVFPRHTIAVANTILKRLKREARPDGTITGANSLVSDFIQNEISPLFKTLSDGTKAIQLRDFRQVDALISRLDEVIGGLPKEAPQATRALLTQLRQGIQADTLTNLRGASPEALQDFTTRFKLLNEEFGVFMDQFVKTTTAKRIGRVSRRGLRGTAFEATATPVDKLVDQFLRVDSPQIARELKTVLPPETFRQLAAETLNKVLDESLPLGADGVRRFSVDTFDRVLGLGGANPLRKEAIASILSESSGLGVKELEDFAAAARAIAKAEIPDASTFIARKAVLQGGRGIVGAIFLTGGAVGGGFAATGVAGGLLMTLSFLGGSRLLAKALADPRMAKSLRVVLNEEADKLVRRNAGFDLLRGLTSTLSFDDEQEFGVSKESLADIGSIFFRANITQGRAELTDAEIRAANKKIAENEIRFAGKRATERAPGSRVPAR